MSEDTLPVCYQLMLLYFWLASEYILDLHLRNYTNIFAVEADIITENTSAVVIQFFYILCPSFKDFRWFIK